MLIWRGVVIAAPHDGFDKHTGAIARAIAKNPAVLLCDEPTGALDSATGIVVLTCEDEEGNVHGATVNSFTSVSLQPPTVLVSLKPGKTHRIISRTGRYGACILNEAQQNFSAHFSGRPQEAVRPDFQVRDRLPTLRHCLAWFECVVVQKVQVHDHTLFVAEVTACGNHDGTPLMFFGSRYHRPAIAV